MTTILLTRPKAASARTVKALAPMLDDARIIISPLFETEFLPPPTDLTPYEGLIFTSENAVRAMGRQAAGCKAWCVGPRTASVAAEAGMCAINGGGTAEMLFKTVREAARGPLMFLRGEEVAVDLADQLNLAGIETVSAIVYRMDLRPLSDVARAAIADGDPIVVPVFSPLAARALGMQMDRPDAPLHLVAISESAAKAWTGPSPLTVSISRTPDLEGMGEAIASHLA